MDIIEVQFTPWDQIYYFGFPDKTDHSLVAVGDKIVVKTTIGSEIGKVVGLRNLSDKEVKKLAEQGQEIKPFVRIANDDDLSQLEENNRDNEEKISICRQFIKKNKINMKLVDGHCSFDGGRITFAFIADGRVDFRNLVRDLTKKFKKSIRLQQLGVRDEAKYAGDFGSCGRGLCCQTHLKKLGNISTEFAKDQLVAHRGSDRLSGLCGRLKCCLLFEEEFYKKELKKFPKFGDQVKTKQGTGAVVNINILKGTYDVRVSDEKKGDIMVKMEVK